MLWWENVAEQRLLEGHGPQPVGHQSLLCLALKGRAHQQQQSSKHALHCWLRLRLACLEGTPCHQV